MNPLKEFLMQSAPLKQKPGDAEFIRGMKCTLCVKEDTIITFTDDRFGNDMRPLFVNPWEYMNFAKDNVLTQYEYTEEECLTDGIKMQTVMCALTWRFCCSKMDYAQPQFLIGLIPNKLLPHNAKETDVIAAMGYLAEPLSSGLIRAYQLLHVERMEWGLQKETLNEVMADLQRSFKNMRDFG